MNVKVFNCACSLRDADIFMCSAYPMWTASLLVSLLQCPGLLCAPSQSEKRHAGQYSSGVAEPWWYKVPSSKEMGAPSRHHGLDTRVCSNRPEGRGGAFSSWPATLTGLEKCLLFEIWNKVISKDILPGIVGWWEWLVIRSHFHCFLCCSNFFITFFHREGWWEFCRWFPEAHHASTSTFVSRDSFARSPDR